MGARRRQLRPLLLAAVAAAAAALGIVLYAADALGGLEHDTVATRFSIRDEKTPPPGVVVVGIDPRTFSELQHRWPLPRRDHASVIRRLTRAGARVIVFDIQFTEPTTLRDDNALFDAISASRRVVLGTSEVNADGSTNVLGGDGNVRAAHATVGSFGVKADRNNTVRRVRYSVLGLPTLAVAAARRMGLHPKPKVFGHHGALIDYRGPAVTIPYWRILDGRFDHSAVRGQVAVVGATAGSVSDYSSTPVRDSMPGPEIQANAISTALRGNPLRDAAEWLAIVAIALAAILPILAAFRFVGVGALALAGLLLAAYLVAAQLAFNGGRVVNVIYPSLTLIVAAVGGLAVNYFTEIRARQRMRTVFGRFVPSAVVDDVLERTDDDLRLGGVRREGTVMFADLRGFTGVAEQLPAERVIELLNRFLGEMCEAVLREGGTLVSYMGDGLMAVFGAPLDQPDHADRALAAAREMAGPRLTRFNEWVRSERLGEGFRMGIGLASGPVMSGNVGSPERMEYAAVGDTTNTASRLEAMTKETPHQVFVSDATHSLARQADGLVEVGELDVRGRAAQMRVWTLAEPGKAAGPA